MSLWFWLAAAAMVVLATVMVVWPMLRPGRSSPRNAEKNANAVIYRRRLKELAAEREQGVLDEASYQQAREELERALVDDLTDTPEDAAEAAASDPRRGRWLAPMAALLVVALTAGLYAANNPLQEMRDAELMARAGSDSAARQEFLERHIERIEESVQERPEDTEAWASLAQAYRMMGRPERAADAFSQVVALTNRAPDALADYAEALALVAGGNNVPDRSYALSEEALRGAPMLPKALWLGGIGAAERGDLAAARERFSRLLSMVPPDAPVRARVEEALRQVGGEPEQQAAAQPAAGGGAALQVQVTLAPELTDRVSAGDTVFVLARAAEGPRAPLAVQRLTVADLPVSLTLSDSMAMVQGMNLSRFDQVVVVAQVSRSGQAGAQAGDLQGSSAPVAPSSDQPVRVTIDEVVGGQ